MSGRCSKGECTVGPCGDAMPLPSGFCGRGHMRLSVLPLQSRAELLGVFVDVDKG
jgi:hypothetical protein